MDFDNKNESMNETAFISQENTPKINFFPVHRTPTVLYSSQSHSKELP